MKPNRHQIVMKKLYDAIYDKYGDAKVQEYKNKFRPLIMEGMDREIICQTISYQVWYRKILFLALYPSYILPYLIRIREKKLAGGQPT